MIPTVNASIFKPREGERLTKITQQTVAQLRFFFTARPNPLSTFSPSPAGYPLEPLHAAVVLNLKWVLASIPVAGPKLQDRLGALPLIWWRIWFDPSLMSVGARVFPAGRTFEVTWLPSLPPYLLSATTIFFSLCPPSRHPRSCRYSALNNLDISGLFLIFPGSCCS